MRDKLIRIFARYKLRILVPNYLGEEVDKSLVDDIQSENLSLSESESESDHTEPNMPLSALDFLNFATKILPEFDGRSENLRRFLDAISWAQTQIEGHENLCVELIKTKLVGSSRNLVGKENSIDQIVNCLKSKVKPESTEVISAKIMNIKQNNKTANQFSVEIENLTKSLENSYIREGVLHSLAEKYSTQAAVRAFSTNSSNDKVKLIMQSGQFQNMNDVVSKFVNSYPQNSHRVLTFFILTLITVSTELTEISQITLLIKTEISIDMETTIFVEITIIEETIDPGVTHLTNLTTTIRGNHNQDNLIMSKHFKMTLRKNPRALRW